MKILCKTLLPLAGLVLLASPVLRADEPDAPPPPDRRERREDMRENAKKMAAELNLTADQQTQIEAIHKQTADAIKAMRADTSLSEDQKRAKGRELRKAAEEQVRAVLTPEQRAKAKELREKRRQGGPGEPPPSGDKPPAT
jgi:Spy/CpxP family protein refolding chaperone